MFFRRKLTEMGEKENEREEFIHAIRKFMEMRTLTKQVLNELIDHIDVYETQGTGKNKTQRLVIDYKFGLKKHNRHTRQVEEYMRLLGRMGYRTVRGYLWYVELKQVENVG